SVANRSGGVGGWSRQGSTERRWLPPSPLPCCTHLRTTLYCKGYSVWLVRWPRDLQKGVHMQVLVTGGAGYIGSVIVEELVGAGHSPVVFDTLLKGHVGAVLPDVPLVQGDARDTERVRQALLEYGIEAVIHMAALAEVEESVRHPEVYFDVNVG